MLTYGYKNANSGGNIAGWKLSTNKLIAPNNTTYLSSNGDYAFYTEQNGTYAGIQHNGTIVGNNVNITGGSLTIGDNFRVTNNGNLTASNANVNGTITTNNITAIGGKIGGWDIGSTTISQTHGNYKVILANYDNNNSDSRILHCQVNGTDTFWVHRDGKLYCTNVDLKGRIEATSGSFSGSISSTSGSIGGWKINKDKLGTDNTYISPVGNFAFYNNHRVVSGSNGTLILNAQQGKGAVFGDGMKDPESKLVLIYASSANKIRLQSSNGIQIRGPISVGTSDSNAKNGLGTISEPKVIVYQTNLTDRRKMKFAYGILIADENN